MIALEFWKMNGAGNDFIVLNNINEVIPEDRFSAIARQLCRRRLSIGADGLMVVSRPRQGGDYRMLFYNSDGSMGEMCGNGARCICRYGYENGLAGEEQTVETTAGLVTGRRISERLYRVRLNDPAVVKLDLPLTVAGRTYQVSYVELGSPGIPHAVLAVEDLTHQPEETLRALGRVLRYHPAFPKGTNVNFYEIRGADRVFQRTYERGVEDFTYACGTGAGALVTVLTLQGRVSGQAVHVTMHGGELIVDLERQGETVKNLFLTGPTNVVAKGEVTDEELAY